MASKYDESYKKAHQRYRDTVKAGSKPAEGQSEKSKAMEEVVAIEREAAKQGINLEAVYRGDNVAVSHTVSDTKRSLQEAYVREFDGEMPVNVGGREQTLREYHKRRLLGVQ
jgi:hypothetical protein